MSSLRHLKIFLVVAECKTMSEAARLLFISQPTVSQSIQELEKEYGIRLFERTPRELTITKEGLVLYKYASSVLHTLDEMDHAVKESANIESIRFGATMTIGDTILGSLLDEFKKNYPHIGFQIEIDNTKNIERKLMTNEIEVALVEGIIKNNDIKVEPVINDCLVLCCSSRHPFAKRSCVELKELANENFILREKGSGTREMFENYMFMHQLKIRSNWNCKSFSAVKQAVIHNYGLTVISARMVQKEVDKGSLCIIPVEGCFWKRHFYLCLRTNREITPTLEKFIEKIRTYSSYGIACPYEGKDS